MEAGDVLLYYKYLLQNGSLKPKYLILLNKDKKENFHIFCLATKYRKPGCDIKSRCNSDKGHFFVGKVAGIFKIDTYLVFYDLPKFSEATVDESISKGESKVVGSIGTNLLNEICNCIKRSNVSKYDINLIYN